MLPSDKLRPFLGRVLGWSNERALELALRSIALALDHRAAVVLCGEGDMVPLAHALHQRTLGPACPFIVCDPRRGTKAASVRSPASRASGLAAFDAAVGGSVCVRMRRLPDDFPALVERLFGGAICTEDVVNAQRSFVLPAPLTVPPLARRSAELDRIIAEYADDAIADLAAPRSSFTVDDHAWVRAQAAASLVEIEKATLRLVAIRTSRNLSGAAARLGMAPVSLTRWIGRRALPPRMLADQACAEATRCDRNKRC